MEASRTHVAARHTGWLFEVSELLVLSYPVCVTCFFLVLGKYPATATTAVPYDTKANYAEDCHECSNGYTDLCT